MTYINEVAQYLEDQGIGTLADDIFVNYMPPKPNSCVMVKSTGGFKPDDYIPEENPTFQILVRDPDLDAAMAKAQAIVSALHLKANLTLVDGGQYFYYIDLLSEPGPIGPDENEREEISLNFRCLLRR